MVVAVPVLLLTGLILPCYPLPLPRSHALLFPALQCYRTQEGVQLLSNRNSLLSQPDEHPHVAETAMMVNPAYSHYGSQGNSTAPASDLNGRVSVLMDNQRQMQEYANMAMMRALGSLSPAAAAELVDQQREQQGGRAGGGNAASPNIRVQSADGSETDGPVFSLGPNHPASASYHPYEEDTWL